MGIFKDLGFTNRNGEVEVPNAETIAGLSIEEFKNSFLPPKIVNDVDSLIQISGSVLPKTITQESGQSNWVKYQATVKHNNIGSSFNKTIYSNQPGTNDGFGRSCAIGATFMLIGANTEKVEMFNIIEIETKPTLTINNVVQTEESSSLTETIYKSQMVNTNTLTISSTGSIESVDINTYILE